MQQARVEIFVLSRNRPDFVFESVQSVLNQTYKNIDVIVSENSTDDTLASKLANQFPSIEIRRRSGLTAYQHMNQALSEATAPYFMIFHDDDVLEPNAIAELVKVLEENPTLSSASPNARIMYGNTLTHEVMNPSLKSDVVLHTPTEVAHRYFDFSLGINPFPAYLYRLSSVKGLQFDASEADQYSDFTFIVKVGSRGPIYWLAQPLMRYRKHGMNYSAKVSPRSTKKAVRFLESCGFIPRNWEESRQFRYWNHFFYLKNQKGRKRRSQLKLVAYYFLSHPKPLIRRVLQKLKSR